MKQKDWLFIILILVMTTFFRPEESVFANENKTFFIPFEEHSLFRPYPKKNSNLELSASSYLSVLVDGNGEKVLFSKNINERRSIASLTKLMTGIIVLENFNLEERISISKKSVNTFGTMGQLKDGEAILARDLLDVMLIESSNDAAEAFAESIGRDKFIKLMNKKASQIGMKDTLFVNPSGLDFDYSNVSNISDLKKLVTYVIDQYPLIYQILSIKEKDLYNNNVFHHKMITTNVLLYENNGYIWGKTGYTVKAGECIILLMKRPFSNKENSYIINIIINSNERFKDARIMEQLIKESFYW
ncbi:MAG TPA: serine hydrolase [Candidatus Pacearchaeota archaeon]|nr:D-alanyl-D-alanine carboxypeptidase [Candidatus Parcubacteria bacterium]HOC53412.1 serine hydrolase [Candidatus Pacearchaeota archaeon]HQM24340.1 serine hydrolase [Candidatus Pacearchaeota archaeon]